MTPREKPRAARVRLRAHRFASGRRDGLVFGANGTNPLDAAKLQDRADAAWEPASVDQVTPHVRR